ncbi:hypothetical protein HNR77_002516 [Paenibacillus sp. JGP012]|uniref:hypothetical protein n=1 Tax=Paenibacillus sp. JGP012 TaxID=2735914 RepID=UPI00160B718B|nr:hypothetical protein [Paenibacillus sp. JGP012]MBB6021421.1 hypothetical protein [Paenibacillus sp. JGP012]
MVNETKVILNAVLGQREINFQRLSSISIDVCKMRCPHCNQIFHEIFDHEIEECPLCESSIDIELRAEEIQEGVYTLILDPQTIIPEIIGMNSDSLVSREALLPKEENLQRGLIKAEQTRDRLVEALEFYAEYGNYLEHIIGWGPEIPVVQDGGQRARMALQADKEGAEA